MPLTLEDKFNELGNVVTNASEAI